MTNSDPIKCISCGKFIAYERMGDTGGARFYFEPSSHFGPEICEWECADCANKVEPDSGYFEKV